MLAPDTLGTDLVSRGPAGDHPPGLQGLEPQRAREPRLEARLRGLRQRPVPVGRLPARRLRRHGGAGVRHRLGRPAEAVQRHERRAAHRADRRAARPDRTSSWAAWSPTTSCTSARSSRSTRSCAKKVRTGARFVINQIGYNARKDDELLRYIAREDLPVRGLANVFLLSARAARAFHAGRIPGVIVTDELLALAERHGASADKGRVVLPRPGRQAAHGRSRARLQRRLSRRPHHRARRSSRSSTAPSAYADGDWRELSRELRFGRAGEFYLFEPDPETGLSSDELTAAIPRVQAQAPDRSARPAQLPLQPRASTRRVFDPDGPLYERGPLALREDRRGAPPGRPRGPRARAGGEGPDVQVPRLRRLLAARHRVRVSGVDLRQEPAQRSRAAARATGCARCTTPSASGHRRTSA